VGTVGREGGGDRLLEFGFVLASLAGFVHVCVVPAVRRWQALHVRNNLAERVDLFAPARSKFEAQANRPIGSSMQIRQAGLFGYGPLNID
jgi:hypothetical protein